MKVKEKSNNLNKSSTLFDGQQIVLDYDIVNDVIHHKTDLITSVFGLPQTIVHAQNYLSRYGVILPESSQDFNRLIQSIRDGAPYGDCVVKAHPAQGEDVWIEIMLTTVFNDDNIPIRAIGVFKDITKQKESELQMNDDFVHRDIMMREAVIYYEANLTTKKVAYGLNQLFKSMGISYTDDYDAALDILVHNVVHPHDSASVARTFSAQCLLEAYAIGERQISLEYRRLTGEGTVLWLRASAYLTQNRASQDIMLYFYATDITEAKLRELSLRERTERDSLTGLYNKVTSELWIQQALEEDDMEENTGAMFLIGLNNFNSINEHRGRFYGDALLGDLGMKLKLICTQEEIVGRNAGIEFIIYNRRIKDQKEAERRARKIFNSMNLTSEDENEKLSFSIGIALFPIHGSSYTTLYRNATTALNYCEKGKLDYQCYRDDLRKMKPKAKNLLLDVSNKKTLFVENIAEYVFAHLYESKELNVTLQAILELCTVLFEFCSGYIYECTREGIMKRVFYFSDTLQEKPDKEVITKPVYEKECRRFIEETCFHIYRREDIVDDIDVPKNCTLRMIYGFKTKDQFRGFIGFDYCKKDIESFNHDKLNSIKCIMQLLDVFLASRNANQELDESTLLLQSIVDGLHNFTYIIEPETHIIKYVNTNTQKGLPEAQPGRRCYMVLRGRNKPCDDCPIDRMIENNTTQDRSEMFLDCFNVWARINASLIKVPSGKIFGVFNGFDFSDKPHIDALSVDALQRFTLDTSFYDALSMSTDDYIIMCDMKTNLFYFPKKMVEEFNLPQQVIKDAIPVWVERIHKDDQKDFMSDISSMFSGRTDTHNQEYRVINKNGTWVWLRARGHVERDEEGNPTTLVVVLTNIGKKSKVDHLTGLLDKYEFEISTRSKLANNVTEGVLLIMGLDNFRYINNIYGWEFGDSVLKEATIRLLSTLPENVQLYRLDGDKFGAFFAGADLTEVKEYYQSVFHLFRQNKQFGEHRYYCTISGGCTYLRDSYVTFNNLFKEANYALDCSKRDGKNRLTIYDESTMSANERLLEIMSLLHESVEKGCKWFEVYFQPQIHPLTLKVQSAEALLRWKTPKFGMISPIEFIPLLEQSGLINKVGRWVLQQAAMVCKEWRLKSPDFTISVNISFAQLQDQSFFPYLTGLVERKIVDPNSIHLEITESCIAGGSAVLNNSLEKIRELGFKIEMDDFGTGYSSLEILKNSPVDVVKIDHAFVKDITSSFFDATFIRFVVTLCHSVGMKVCLEGVEKWEEYELVRPMELDIIQGFLFGKPQPKKTFDENFVMNSFVAKQLD